MTVEIAIFSFFAGRFLMTILVGRRPQVGTSQGYSPTHSACPVSHLPWQECSPDSAPLPFTAARRDALRSLAGGPTVRLQTSGLRAWRRALAPGGAT